MPVVRPNRMLIRSTRPVKAYAPYRQADGSARNGAPAPSAFVGWISGLGTALRSARQRPGTDPIEEVT
jgi:hypothetical protein